MHNWLYKILYAMIALILAFTAICISWDFLISILKLTISGFCIYFAYKLFQRSEEF